MCVAIIKRVGQFGPSDRMLHHLWRKNSDGAGFCVVRNGLVSGSKGFMTEDEFVEGLRAEVTKDDLAFLHMRIATHGGVNPGGTHPFPAEADEDLLNETEWSSPFGIMHNGTIGGFGYKTQGSLSDTQEFIHKILHDRVLLYSLFSNRDNSAFIELLEDKIRFNRIAIMRRDGKYYTFGDWKEAGGCLYSNEDFKGISPKDTEKIVRRYKAGKEVRDRSERGGPAKKTSHAQIFDKELERTVPYDTKTRTRIDSEIRCPTCREFDGVPVMIGGIEMCTLCMPDRVQDSPFENGSSAPVYTARELAKPKKKAKEIRALLLNDYELTFCPFPEAFIPKALCKTCVNSGLLNGSCWKLENLRKEDPNKYNRMMGGSKDKDCILELESLGEIGFNHITVDFAMEEEHERQKNERIDGGKK